MAAIVAKRDRASKELAPLLGKIEKVGDKAWTKVQSGGQEFYVAKDGPNLVWSYVSETFLDASTQQSWANNDMAAIVAKRDQASKQLAPLLDKIEKEGDKAWTKVQSGGQEFYVAKDGPNLVWSYVTQKPGGSGTSDATISVGQYCKATNSIGVSGYRWGNIPERYQSEIKKIALAFVYMIKPLIADGIEWGLKYAQSQLVQYLSQALATGLAVILPASLAASGGLAIAGIIGSLVAYGAMKFFKKLIKKYTLILNVYNFDIEHEWSSLEIEFDATSTGYKTRVLRRQKNTTEIGRYP
ncbi:hypothetical protein RSAG8_13037, partial [Rhizoctonia solani AG-8 WAC10335]